VPSNLWPNISPEVFIIRKCPRWDSLFLWSDLQKSHWELRVILNFQGPGGKLRSNVQYDLQITIQGFVSRHYYQKPWATILSICPLWLEASWINFINWLFFRQVVLDLTNALLTRLQYLFSPPKSGIFVQPKLLYSRRLFRKFNKNRLFWSAKVISKNVHGHLISKSLHRKTWIFSVK
jgi:hypothetical protein